MKIAIILTSHDRMGATNRPTGFWAEEFATPYYTFLDAGAEVVLASPRGGRPPVDPTSLEPAYVTDSTRRLDADPDAQARLDATLHLDALRAADLDAAFYPGGHGPMWDLVDDAPSTALIEALTADGRPVAAVCHGPVVLVNARAGDGRPLVEGRRVTSFSDSEEAAIDLTDVVPFLLESRLRELGGIYSKAGDWAAHIAADGPLLTGQNPASSGPLARALLDRVGARAGRPPRT